MKITYDTNYTYLKLDHTYFDYDTEFIIIDLQKNKRIFEGCAFAELQITEPKYVEICISEKGKAFSRDIKTVIYPKKFYKVTWFLWLKVKEVTPFFEFLHYTEKYNR